MKYLTSASSEVEQQQATELTKKDYEFNMDETTVTAITQVAVADRISYIYLKYKLLEARI